MNLLRMPTLLFIGLLILIAERIYFFNKNDHAAVDEQAKTVSPDDQYSRFAQPTKNVYTDRNANDFDEQAQKVVIHSPNTGLEPAPVRRISSSNSDEIWQKYSVQMPRVYWLSDTKNNDVDYSEGNARQLQYLAYNGDALAQFFYAYALTKQIEADAVANKASLESARQTKRFKEIRDLHVKAAAKGVYPSARELSRIYLLPGLKDSVEALAWGLIADAMRRGEDRTLESICTDANNAPCTNELLSKALDRAKSYLKMHSFKIQK